VFRLTKALQKWLLTYYAKLWKKFGSDKFTHKNVKRLLKIKNVSNVLSRLKKAGWLEISLDPKDSRKSIYRLKSPEKAIKEIV
jgi:hypothetical protein